MVQMHKAMEMRNEKQNLEEFSEILLMAQHGVGQAPLLLAAMVSRELTFPRLNSATGVTFLKKFLFLPQLEGFVV